MLCWPTVVRRSQTSTRPQAQAVGSGASPPTRRHALDKVTAASLKMGCVKFRGQVFCWSGRGCGLRVMGGVDRGWGLVVEGGVAAASVVEHLDVIA